MKKRPAYGHVLKTSGEFQETIGHVEEALKSKGFGVLTRVDVDVTLRKKMGLEMEPYTILGVCNPLLASQALELDEHIGLLLPCNVIVYQRQSKVRVGVVLPTEAMAVTDNPALGRLAKESERLLVDGIAMLTQQHD